MLRLYSHTLLPSPRPLLLQFFKERITRLSVPLASHREEKDLLLYLSADPFHV